MEFLKYIPLIIQLISKAQSIHQAIRNGESVIELLKREAPMLIDMLSGIGKDLFPGITDPAAQVEAGAMATDQVGVKAIQTQLNKLGASPPLIADGSYGPKTKAAVSAFQTKMGLTVDGWAGKNTQAAMKSEIAKLGG